MKNISFIVTAGALFVAASASAQQVTRIPAGDKLLAGTPTPQFSVGAEDGEDWELLSRVSGAAFDARDNLYVLDAGNNRVLVFDAKGKFVRRIGKKGGGPGELLSPVGLAITRDGYIAITDLGRPAISLFKTDGSFVKNLMLGDSLGFPSPQGGTVAHPNAGVVVRSMPLMMRPQGADRGTLGGPTGPRKSPVTWLTVNEKAAQLFAIELPSLTPKVEDAGSGSGRRNVSVRISQPAFTPPTLWGVLPNGSVAVADEADYKIKIANHGKVERVIERAIQPRKVTEQDKNKARDLRRKAMKSGSGMIIATRTDGPGGSSSHIGTGGGAPRISDADIDQQLREMTFLDQVPVLQRMMIDPKGRMWIERVGRQVGDNGPVDIIDSAGKYLGTLNGKMPDAISATGRAAYVEKDDMDVEKVVVRKLPAAWL
jgi:hypothetical protein